MAGNPRSVSQTAIYKRLQRLPKLVEDAIEASARRDAEGVIERFHDGIKEDKLGLVPLKEPTISRKEALDLEKPESPLYALGDEFVQGTFANMLECVRDGQARRYAVRPRDEYHYTVKVSPGGERTIVRTKLKLKDLFEIHEYGCTLHSGARLPPRPALRYAYEKYLRERAKLDPAKKVRDAIRKFVKDGDEKALVKIRERLG